MVDARGIRIGVLGPVRLDMDGVERPLTARRQRAVLACLVLHVGEAVSADRLLHDVWGPDFLPGSGVKAVAYQISKLRGLLGSHSSAITTTTAGYRLVLDRDRIDAHVADELIDRSREALTVDPQVSEALVERALRLRRGRPFADLDDVFVDVEVQRLEGRHLLARRTLAEARLAQGRAADVIGDLGALLAEHPLEEAVAAALMTALERSGRPADALASSTTSAAAWAPSSASNPPPNSAVSNNASWSATSSATRSPRRTATSRRRCRRSSAGSTRSARSSVCCPPLAS